jgi:mannose-6-phosphate isomerase-like protein (cupin superfamily)
MGDGAERPATQELRQSFDRDGFAGPLPVLSASQCRIVSRYLDASNRPSPPDWDKGHGASDRLLCELALTPALVDAVRELIGPDVILWGVSSADKEVGELHPWHTDIETSAPEPGTVTAWIGIENTSAESSLQLIAGSHRVGAPLQKVAAEHGVPRAQRTGEAALRLAATLLPHAGLVQVALRDGEALLFDGRLWHGSLNSRAQGRRRALLFQYAAARRPIRIPDWNHLEWPFVLRHAPLPPVIPVAGQPDATANRVVALPPRSPEGLAPLRSTVRQFAWPLPGDPVRGWRPHHMFRGPTPVQNQLGCHVSVLFPGCSPHPPHAHLDEEVLVVLDGSAEIVIADSPDDASARVERLDRGDFAFYPSWQHHTIRCPGPGPVTYLMFRWQGTPESDPPELGTRVERARPPLPGLGAGRFASEPIFEGRSGLLPRLHAHWSHVGRAGGYDPHDDDYDVALVLLTGRVRTLGRTIRAPAVVFYPAGADHGLRGASDEPAEYLVFEWHGQRRMADVPAARPGSLLVHRYREARCRAQALLAGARGWFRR